MRCENCGHEFDAFPGEPCPRCGHSSPVVGAAGSGETPAAGTPSSPPAAPPSGSAAAGPPPPPPSPPRDGPPWERDRSAGSLFGTLKGILLEPSRTFGEANPEGGIGWPLLYWLIFTTVGTLVAMFWNLLSNAAGLGTLEQWGELIPPEFEELLGGFEGPTAGLAFFYVLWFPVYLAMATLFLFVWAGIAHLLLMLVNGANRSFEASFRAVAYGSGSAAIFQVVPVCGGLIGFVWSIVAQIVGMKELHDTTGGKATFAILAPLAFCCACGVVMAIVAISMFAAMASG